MKKVAILFGNDKYDFSNAQLQCAVNDAEALQEKLDALSFETKSILNSDMKTMAMEIANFETTLPNYDVGLFFFAGHGFQFDGLNYLAATDTSFADDRSAAYTSFRLDDIIAAMNRKEYEEGWYNLEKADFQVDYILTHSGPREVVAAMGYGEMSDDEVELRQYLQRVADNTDFVAWYFGHFHEDTEVEEMFYCLYDDLVVL